MKKVYEDLYKRRMEIFESTKNRESVLIDLTLESEKGRIYFLNNYILTRLNPVETLYVVGYAFKKRHIMFDKEAQVTVLNRFFAQKVTGGSWENIVFIDCDINKIKTSVKIPLRTKRIYFI
jgi:hypothetical protein